MTERALTKYEALCKADEDTVNPAVVDGLKKAVVGPNGLDITLRGSGSLRPELKKCLLVDKDVVRLMQALQDCTVSRLDLSFNRITNDSCQAISRFLEEPQNSHMELLLASNDIGVKGVQVLMAGLQINDGLQTLDLSGNKIGSKGGMLVASLLQISTTLAHLRLNETDQDESSMIAFATVLNTNHTVKSLSLDRPLLKTKQDDISVHFGNMLERNRGLTFLSLRKCRITDVGAARLSEKLAKNSSLKSLDLSCNEISANGAKSLQHMLTVNTTLANLNLSFNLLRDAGMLELLQACKENAGLQRLGVAHNNIGSSAMLKFAEIMQQRPLKAFTLWGNPGVSDLAINGSACLAINNLLKTPEASNMECDLKPYATSDGRIMLAEREAPAII